MFRKYSCDCIGFEITDEGGHRHAYCVWACDAPVDAPDVGLWSRPGLLDKSSEPLSFKRTTELLKQLNSLVNDGSRLRTVVEVLGISSAG